jgi:hypothetical protein
MVKKKMRHMVLMMYLCKSDEDTKRRKMKMMNRGRAGGGAFA